MFPGHVDKEKIGLQICMWVGKLLLSTPLITLISGMREGDVCMSEKPLCFLHKDLGEHYRGLSDNMYSLPSHC